MEPNIYVFVAMDNATDERNTLTICEYDDRFEVHTSDDPHGQPEVFNFDADADKAERYGMVSQLINIYLTTPTIDEEQSC